MMATGASYDVVEVGYFGAGQFIPCEELSAGMVGYITASIKNVRDTRVGDTITDRSNPCKEPLPGYKKVTPMAVSYTHLGIIPGVMAQTGMETAEILKGVIAETRPDAVLAVDALAARSVRRLGVTIQLSDAGIHPGSGVGNHRNSLTRETLGVPVIAIGVPTVVGAAAIVHDTVGALVAALKEGGEAGYGDMVEHMDGRDQYQLIREVLEPQIGPMYVTPHNIDEMCIRDSGE